MAQLISPRFSLFRALLSPTGPLPRAGVKFKHSSGSVHMTAGLRARSSSTAGTREADTAAAPGWWWWRSARGLRCSSPRRQTSWRGRFALGAALGATVTGLVHSLHTGAAMALKINLHAAEGDWKEVKASLQSLSQEDRRQYYRTPGFVPLDDIPLWTPPAGDSEGSRTQRNEKLDQKISVYRGDITQLEIGAIVNAANNTLLGGGGVDGAIHRAAGPWLKKECASLNGCETGEAKITCGYGLPANFVIHTVGPIVTGRVGETERKNLRSCYMNSLKMATENSARTVAFPCISTGIYGYPPEQAVHEALATVREYLDVHHDKLDRVIFCVFSPADKQLYLDNLPLYFPGAPTEATVKSKL